MPVAGCLLSVAGWLLAVAILAAAPSMAAAEVPAPQGFVTDLTGTLKPTTRDRLTRLAEELKAKTGAEIAVLVVDTTAPLDDFTYGMEVADAWKVGARGEDTGVLVLLALKDRKLRVFTGYGVEGILPDGLVGEIQDREMIPALRRGDVDAALLGGAGALAARIAAARGVVLDGARAAPADRDRASREPSAVNLLALLIFLAVVFAMGRMGILPLMLLRGGRGGFHGGFGGGGGGFGGFGGGGFGGGGAGRSW